LKRPSTATTIAVVALVVALAGGGQAIADGTAQIARKLTGSDIKKNSITGKQVRESTLGKVPKAINAESINNATVKTFNWRDIMETSRTSVSVVYNDQTTVLRARCLATGPQFEATSEKGISYVAWITSSGTPSIEQRFGDEQIALIDAATRSGAGTLQANSSGGYALTAQYAYKTSNSGACSISGTVVVSDDD